MVTECVICYDTILQNINCVTTECGHTFHTNCLMKHTVCNGYTCPCCRRSMAATTEADHNSVSESEYEDDSISSESIELYNEYVLDGCRWMFQRANGNGHLLQDDAEDPYTDSYELWHTTILENERIVKTNVDRRGDLILDMLKKIKAFSHDDLVKGYLYSIDDFFRRSDQYIDKSPR